MRRWRFTLSKFSNNAKQNSWVIKKSLVHHICNFKRKTIVEKVDPKGMFKDVFKDVEDINDMRNKKIKKKKGKKDDN